MEIVMTKMLKHFSLLFVLMFSVVSAEIKEDPYRLYVTEVDSEFHCFALSNHMVFNIPERNWKADAFPEVGTEVYSIDGGRCIPDPKHECVFVFEYSQDSTKKRCYAWITPESKQYGLSCILSKTICTAPAGYIFSPEYRDVLQLSDGSQWIKENSTKTRFGPESRVVVSKLMDGSYSIVDLDESDWPCSCSATTGRTLTWHRYERVKPYVPGND
jgi:hypothetical protein